MPPFAKKRLIILAVILSSFALILSSLVMAGPDLAFLFFKASAFFFAGTDVPFFFAGACLDFAFAMLHTTVVRMSKLKLVLVESACQGCVQ